jgi:hypothetical protein
MPDVHGIASQIFPNNALGLTIAAIVFFIAVIFIIRSLFAVIFTAILLFVAYISGEAIATNSLFNEWVGSKSTSEQPGEKETWESRFTEFKGQLMQNIEDLRKENPEKTEAKPAEKPEVKPAEPSK